MQTSESIPIRERYMETPAFKAAQRQVEWLLLRLTIQKMALPLADLYTRLVGNHPLIVGNFEITFRRRDEKRFVVAADRSDACHVSLVPEPVGAPVTDESLLDMAQRDGRAVMDRLCGVVRAEPDGTPITIREEPTSSEEAWNNGGFR